MKAVDGRQLRAARIILGWTSEDAARAAGVHRNSVTRTEAFQTLPYHAHAADRMSEAMAEAGIIFGTDENGPNLSFRAPSSRMSRRALQAFARLKNEEKRGVMCSGHKSRPL